MMRRLVLCALLAFLAASGEAFAQATTTALTPWPKARFEDNNGNPCSGCLLFTYTAGTTTKLSTYTDSTGDTANANPVVLNSRGEANVWLPYGTLYKFVLSPSTDTDPPTNAIWTVDNIPATSTINQEFVVSTADKSWTSDTALATVTGLTLSLTAAKTYNCNGHLTVTASGASGGVRVALSASDGLTATSASFTAANYNGTTNNARSTTTSLGVAIGGATAVATDIYIDGAIVVNEAGSISVSASQNASNATTTTVGKNSTFYCVRVN